MPKKVSINWTKEEVSACSSYYSRNDSLQKFIIWLAANNFSKLERVENTAASLLCIVSRLDHISPVPFRLCWLPVQFRIRFKVLVITLRAINGVVPAAEQFLLRSAEQKNAASLSFLPSLQMEPNFHRRWSSKVSGLRETLTFRIPSTFPSTKRDGWTSQMWRSGFASVCRKPVITNSHC